MENTKKKTLTFLSVSQIVMSVFFFILGMVDGLKIRYVYVSLVFSPYWIVPLALTNGIMGLVLSKIHKRSSNLIHAIWSFSVACIVYSTVMIMRYQYWGAELLLLNKHSSSSSRLSSSWPFLKKDAKPRLTDQENEALAVFCIIIVCSIIEIIVAAALAKVSDASNQVAVAQPFPMYAMYYQPGQVSDLQRQGNAYVGSGVFQTTAQDIPPPYHQNMGMSPH